MLLPCFQEAVRVSEWNWKKNDAVCPSSSAPATTTPSTPVNKAVRCREKFIWVLRLAKVLWGNECHGDNRIFNFKSMDLLEFNSKYCGAEKPKSDIGSRRRDSVFPGFPTSGFPGFPDSRRRDSVFSRIHGFPTSRRRNPKKNKLECIGRKNLDSRPRKNYAKVIVSPLIMLVMSAPRLCVSLLSYGITIAHYVISRDYT